MTVGELLEGMCIYRIHELLGIGFLYYRLTNNKLKKIELKMEKEFEKTRERVSRTNGS